MSITVPISKLKLDPSKRVKRSLRAKFGATAGSLPLTIGRSRMPVHDQGLTDDCTPFGEAVSGSYETGIDCSPEYQTAMESEYLGKPITWVGAYPIDSINASLLFQHLPAIDTPLTLDQAIEKYGHDTGIIYNANGVTVQNPGGESWIANPKNYPDAPLIGTERLCYDVTGSGDVFDDICQALNNSWISGDKTVVKAFGNWYSIWNDQAQNFKGNISGTPSGDSSPHRYTFVDFFTDATGTQRLIAHMTQGTEYGDNGFVYFDRASVNGAFANMATDGSELLIPRSGGNILSGIETAIYVLITRLKYSTWPG